MNRHMKKVLKLGLAVLSVGWLAGKAQAASTDTITLSLTPNTTYAVSMSSVTGGVGYQFGNVNLNATTVSTAAIVITNSGSVYEFFALSVSSPTSGSWSPNSTAPGVDTYVLSGQYAGSQPAQGSGSFSALTNTAPSASAALYGQASTKTAPAGTQKLWLQLQMPTSLNNGGTGQQTMTLRVTGQAT